MLLGWSPADLARGAGLSVFRVRAFEAGRVSGRRASMLMQRAMMGAGVKFAENGDVSVGDVVVTPDAVR